MDGLSNDYFEDIRSILSKEFKNLLVNSLKVG